MVEKFQKAPFEEIAAHCGARVRQSHFPSRVVCFLFFFHPQNVLSSNDAILSLPGHPTAEQTQSDL